MHVVIVTMEVRPERRQDFLDAMAVNAQSSLRDEPGCLRFDVLEDLTDPHRFVLYEIYTDEAAFSVAHKSAPHYQVWNELAPELLTGERSNTLLTPAFDGAVDVSVDNP